MCLGEKKPGPTTNAKLKDMILTNWACWGFVGVQLNQGDNKLVENDCGIIADLAANSLPDMISIIAVLILSIFLPARIHYLFLPVILFFPFSEIMQIRKNI